MVSFLPAPLPQNADARNRALRTFAQGLAVDVGAAVIALLLVLLADVRWTKVYWLALGAALLKTAITTAASYVMRHLKPPPTS